MLQLYIDGEIVNLSKDLQTDYYVKSPFFTNEGDFTLDIDINLRDPQNAKVYRLINRLDRVKRASRREAVLQDEHGVLLRGREVILETHDGYAKIQIVGGTSELNYIMSDTYLQDLDLWMSFERNEVEYAPVCAYNQAPHAKYGMMDSEQYKTEGGKRVLVWTMVNKPTWAADGTLNMSHDTPLPYFWAIINRVITALGFKVGENVIQTDVRYSQMVMVHAYKTTYIAEMLPRWTVTELFEEYQKFFNVIFDVDKKTRTVNIYHAHSYFDTTGMEEIPITDVINEVEKKFDVDNDMTMVNYARAHYAFTDKLQNKYSALPPELVRICSKVDAQSVSGARQFDQNYYVGIWKAKTGGESFLSSESAISGVNNRVLYKQVINGEDRYFVQWAAEDDYNGLVMVNAFAAKTSANDKDTDVEMKIVPVRMASSPKVGSSPWWTHPLPAVDGEASSWGGHSFGGSEYEASADDIIDDIENGYEAEKKTERADVMFAGFYFGEVSIRTWEDLDGNDIPTKATVPIVAPENIMQIHRPRTYGDGKSWKCSLNVLKLPENINVDVYHNSKVVNGQTVYEDDYYISGTPYNGAIGVMQMTKAVQSEITFNQVKIGPIKRYSGSDSTTIYYHICIKGNGDSLTVAGSGSIIAKGNTTLTTSFKQVVVNLENECILHEGERLCVYFYRIGGGTPKLQLASAKTSELAKFNNDTNIQYYVIWSSGHPFNNENDVMTRTSSDGNPYWSASSYYCASPILRLIRTTNPENNHLTMAIVGEHGMDAHSYALNPHVDTATEYTIQFRGRANMDVRKIWLVGNRKFYCKELKCHLDSGKRSEIVEGTFFPLLLPGTSEGGETVYYVTYNLSRVVIENRIPQVLANEPLHLDLAMATGGSASSVINATVTMGNVDVTSSVFARVGRRATIDVQNVTGDVYIQAWVE